MNNGPPPRPLDLFGTDSSLSEKKFLRDSEFFVDNTKALKKNPR